MSEAHPVEVKVEVETAHEHAVVPIPGSLRSEQPKTPFWRRISLRGARARAEGSLSEPTSDDRILARLDGVVLARIDGIAAQVAASEQRVGQRIEQLDEKFNEVWEVEETLSRLIELHELVTEMRDRQGRIDTRVRGLERRLSVIAVLAGTAAVAGIVAAFVAIAL